ncbi:hypothetical protein ACRAWF_23135 [Streptomyces sp. L7]
MTKRWKQRPPRLYVGRLGRGRRTGPYQPAHPEEGPPEVREVEAGVSFSLSLPLDYPGGSALNQRRCPPILRPTEDLAHKQDVFYNVVASEQIDPSLIDVWSDDVVTLWLQYSAVGPPRPRGAPSSTRTVTGSPSPSTTTGSVPVSTSCGPEEDAKGDGSGSLSFARYLGLEKMAEHGVQGRGVLVDIAPTSAPAASRSGFKQLQDIMTADNVVVEPGDMVTSCTPASPPRSSPGRRTRTRWRSTRPPPTSTRTTRRSSTGSRTRRCRR